MPVATEIATAYIALVPSFKGGAAAIASEMGGPSEAAGKDAGGKFGGAFGGAVKGLAAAGALFGGAAILSGAFQQALTQADLPGTLKNQFALTEGAAAEAAKAAGDVYAAGWGTSLEQVGTSAATVTQELEKLGQTGDVTKLTTQAEALAGAFDQDVNQTILAASQLVKTGLAPDFETAFDTITAGFQSGANASGDLLDTITEYGVQFQNLGIEGPAAMGLINQGLEAGARSGDLVADAIKEFSIRAIDGSKLTSEGFDAIGLSAGDMAATIAAGGPEAATALDTVLDSLSAMEDPVVRVAAAVKLFGTQAEDLGDALFALDPSEAVTALGDVTTAAELTDAAGSTTSAKMTELGRSFKTGLADALTPIIPLLQGAMDVLIPLAPILGPIALAIAAVTIAQWAWNVAMMANPIGLIIIAVVALIAIIWAIVANWDTIKNALLVNWEFTKAKAAEVWGAIKDFFVMIGTAIKDFFVGIWNGITGFLTGVWNTIVSIATSVWNGIKAFFSSIWNAIVTGVRTQVQIFLSIIDWFKELPGKVKAWFGALKDAAVNKLVELVNWAKGLPGRISDALGNIKDKLLDKGKDLINGLLNGMKNAAGAVKDWVMGLLGDIADSVKDFFGIASPSKLMHGFGENIGDGLARGIRASLGNVTIASDALSAAAAPMDVSAGLTGPQMNLSDADRQLLGGAGVHIDTAEFRAADNRFDLEQMRQQFAMQVI